MEVRYLAWGIALPLLVAAEEQTRAATPEWRAKALAAMAAVILLGGLLLAVAWLAGRAARNYGDSGPRYTPTFKASRDDWASKPIVPNPDDSGVSPGSDEDRR